MQVEKFDIIGSLPVEISHKIFLNLTEADIENALKCCKKWKRIMNYEYLWESLYRKFYIETEEPNNTEFFLKTLQSYSLYWQGRFMYNRALQLNMENNIFKKIPFQFNRINFNDCIHFDGRTLILSDEASNREKKMFIFDSSTGLMEYQLPLVDDYNMVIKHGNLIINCSISFHLKIWNTESRSCITDITMPFREEEIFVSEIQACRHVIILITSRRDNVNSMVHTFDMKTLQFRLLGNSMRACCTNNIIAISKSNGNIEIVDSDFNSLAKFNCSESHSLNAIKMNDDFFIKWSNNQQIRHVTIWNIKTKTNFKIFKNIARLRHIQLIRNKNLICFVYSKLCQVWDLTKENCLFEIVSEKYIYGLILSDRYIFMKLLDNQYKVCCLKTGRFVENICVSGKPHLSLMAAANSKLLYYHYNQETEKSIWQIFDYELKPTPTTTSWWFTFLLNIKRYICSLLHL